MTVSDLADQPTSNAGSTLRPKREARLQDARIRRRRSILTLLIISLLVIGAASLALGSGNLADAGLRWTFLSLRSARLAAAVLTGAALAVGGVLVQGLFRNPLADASILGTTAGAALGGKLAMLAIEYTFARRLFQSLPSDALLPIGCMLGALGALGVLLMLLRNENDLLTLLLTGFVLSSLFVSFGSLATSVAQERWELGRAIVAFTLGGFGGVGLRHIALGVPLILAGIVASWMWARPLDLLLCGEEEAASLGVNVTNVRRCCVIWIAVLTAAAVALGGNIGFVGLLVPHALRPLLGAEHRTLIPAAALGGAAFVAACDALARIVPSRSEVPLGVITGVLGAPLFLLLLVRTRRERHA